MAIRNAGWPKAAPRSAASLPVNTDGGCLACGEPIGASGLRQVYENVMQLRGRAGARQVPGNPAAYTHVYGAPGVSAVTILEALMDYGPLSPEELAFPRRGARLSGRQSAPRCAIWRPPPHRVRRTARGQAGSAILERSGWLGYQWPVECGGTGLDAGATLSSSKRNARWPGRRRWLSWASSWSAPVICAFGTPEQKARFLPRILSGEDYWCQGFSEPGSGSDLASLQDRARLDDGDEYIINGSKIWTTHAHHADWIFALVRTDAR
jgi:hypothetical protein